MHESESAARLKRGLLPLLGVLGDGAVGLNGELCAPSHAAASPATATALTQRNSFFMRVSLTYAVRLAATQALGDT